MIRTTCPEDHDLLPLASGEQATGEVTDHVVGCPACSERVDRLTAEVRSLRRSSAGASAGLHGTGPADGSGSGSSGATADWTPLDATRATATASGAPAGGHPALPVAIGKYLVVGELDRGGQAVVYRVVHAGLGRELALKYALKPLADGDPARRLIADEARVLAGVPEHSGLVRVHDMDLHEGHLYMVMDFVRGRSLAQYAKDQPIAPRQAAALVAEAARAVDAAHRCGVVHQDIKLKNILVDDQNRARLIDFGLARLRHAWSGSSGQDDGADGPSGGTPEFMAPEQARDEADKVGPRSDVFALGAVLYALLTGKPPFAEKDRKAALGRAVRCEFDREALRRPGIPRRLARVVLRAMAAEPDDRYSSAHAMAADLEAFLRRPKLVAAQAGALLLCAAAAVIGLIQPHPVTDISRSGPMVNPPEPLPLGVKSFQVELHRRTTKTLLGPIGVNAFAGRFEDDDVRVRARLNAPAYCYLVALNPDGKVQPCYPEDPKKAPLRSSEVNFPADPAIGFGLTDGIGLQAFVLIASTKPLPPLEKWLQAAGELPWQKTVAERVWRYDGIEFATDPERGEFRPLADLPKPLEAACRALRARPQVDAIQAIAFPVKAQSDSEGRTAPSPGASNPAAGHPPEKAIDTAPLRVLPAARRSGISRSLGFVRGFLRDPGRPAPCPKGPPLAQTRQTRLVLASFGESGSPRANPGHPNAPRHHLASPGGVRDSLDTRFSDAPEDERTIPCRAPLRPVPAPAAGPS
jgi:hypothetical protein